MTKPTPPRRFVIRKLDPATFKTPYSAAWPWQLKDAARPAWMGRARSVADALAKVDAVLESERQALCNCGSIDKYGDDLDAHSPSCPYLKTERPDELDAELKLLLGESPC